MGKSTLAQRLAVAQGVNRVYIATMRPHDREDDRRILRHRRERDGWGFQTVECSTHIERLCDTLPDSASLLLDSTTALLAEEMFAQDGTMDPLAADRVPAGLLRVFAAFSNVVVVSDSIYADGVRYADSTEAYRRGLAAIDRSLAAAGDAVIEMSFGQPFLHKGPEGLAGWLRRDAACGRGVDSILPLPEPTHGGQGG